MKTVYKIIRLLAGGEFFGTWSPMTFDSAEDAAYEIQNLIRFERFKPDYFTKKLAVGKFEIETYLDDTTSSQLVDIIPVMGVA